MFSRNNRIFISLIFVFLLALAACSQPAPAPDTTGPETSTAEPATAAPTGTATAGPTATPTAEPTASPTATPTQPPVAQGPGDFPPNVNPLTGLFVSNPGILNRNPVLVKVSNFPRTARPHAGLSFADMVFEYTIGEGGTRFTALFYGQDAPQVGPVRSARLIDASLGQAFQGILGFVGADPFVFGRIIDALGARAITENSGTCPALCRTGSGDVNSVFVDTGQLTDFAEQDRGIEPERPFLDGLLFDPVAPEAGSKLALNIQVRYSSAAISEWRYDPVSGLYMRWIESLDAAGNVEMIELIDRVTDEQLGFENVVVLFAEHTELKPTLHEIEILGNTQGRRAILFRDGQIYDIVWRSVGNQPPQFYFLDGAPVPFKPGSTWFHVVGINSPVSEPAAGDWSIQFRMP
jgi:hypothetical protein